PYFRLRVPLVHEGVVLRDAAVFVDADDFAQVVAKVLRRGELKALAERKIKVALIVEYDPVAKVVWPLYPWLLAEDDFEALDPVVHQFAAPEGGCRFAFWPRRREGKVNHLVAVKVRVQ